MTDDQQRPRSSLAVWLIVAVILPVTYVALSGPACWLSTRGYLDSPLRAAYAPLFYASLY